jgi:integrase
MSKLPSGSWRGQVALPGPGRERRSFTSRDKDAVELWLREQSRALRAGEDVDTVRTRLVDHLQDWLTEVGPTVRPTTLRGYRIHVDLWITPSIGDVPITDLTARHIRLVRDKVLAKGRSPRTAAGVLLTLRMALRHAVDDGLISRNVAEAVRPPRSTRAAIHATSADEARAILAAFERHRLGPLVTVAIGTGLRLGELLGLRWADIDHGRLRVTGSVRPVPRDEGKGIVLVRSVEAKTRRSLRTLELAPFVLAALEDQRRAQAAAGILSPYVFTTTGRREHAGEAVFMDPKNVTLSFQSHLKASKLPTMRFHDLRHAYATLMLSAGVPLRVISESLGHTSIATTAGVYAHVLPDLQRDAAERLQAVIGGDSHT